MIVVGILLVIALVLGLSLGLAPCGDGYAGMGVGNCDDIDECTDGSHTCHEDAACTNNLGGFECACKKGYKGTGDVCVDIDECARPVGPLLNNCHRYANCTNLPSNYSCSCKTGT